MIGDEVREAWRQVMAVATGSDEEPEVVWRDPAPRSEA